MKITKRGIHAAAICLGVVAAIGLIGGYGSSKEDYFTMDINPSMEFKLNHMGKVGSVQSSNADAQELLAGYNGKNKEVEQVVKEVIELLVLNGYIKETRENDILISVEKGNQSQKLLTRVKRSIQESLVLKQVDAMVISQKIEKNRVLTRKAEKNCISPGKMSLIHKIVAENQEITEEELVHLRISDLLDFASAKGTQTRKLVDKIENLEVYSYIK
ncbi:MAG: hypothetical protein RR223_05795 [Lachnospiraceae bacterium]